MYSINNFQNNEEKRKLKLEENANELNKVSTELLDTCMDVDTGFVVLQDCKDVAIPKILEICKEKINSSLEICSDPHLMEFSTNIDQRIDIKKQQISQVEVELKTLEEKLANIEEKQLPPLFYVSHSSGEIIDDYPQLIRACIRYQETKNNYSEIDVNTLEISEQIQLSYVREDLGFCLTTIKEIEDKCEFNGLCSGIDKFYETRNQ